MPGARLRATFGGKAVKTIATGRVLVPPSDAEFGVISDLDDTVIQSDVIRKLRMLVKLALSNAHTRKPFRGVAAFYRALHRGRNPFFYVSKSPHNLYSPLVEFLQHQGDREHTHHLSCARIHPDRRQMPARASRGQRVRGGPCGSRRAHPCRRALQGSHRQDDRQ